MTLYGGADDAGTIFKIDPGGATFTVFHAFNVTNDGGAPFGSLTLSSDGATLYGMTNSLGAHDGGTVFKMDTGGATFTVLHAFGDPGVSNDGLYPLGSLTLSIGGTVLYGMTPKGGANGTGTLFSVSAPTQQLLPPLSSPPLGQVPPPRPTLPIHR